MEEIEKFKYLTTSPLSPLFLPEVIYLDSLNSLNSYTRVWLTLADLGSIISRMGEIEVAIGKSDDFKFQGLPSLFFPK